MAKPRRRFSPYLAGVSATFLLVAVLHAPLSAADDEPPPWTICDPYGPNGQYAENGTFGSNIKLLAASLPRNASSSPALYATGSVGDVPYMVYGQALCRGDVSNASACESCVSTAFRGAQQACPLYKDAMIFYDLCQIRFSNRNFFIDNDYTIATYTLQRSRLVGAPAPAFDTAVELLVNATVDHVHAVGDSSRRFGTGEEGFYDRSSPKIYALSQCAPDRTADACRTCLGYITGRLPGSFSGRTGGGVFGVWCNFRYEVYPFFSGRPLLQLPQFVEKPPASAAPPATRGGERTRNRTGKVLAIVVPTIVVILATTVVYFFCWKKRRPQADGFLPPTSDDIQHINSLLLDLATLRVATDDFEESKILGKGGFGMVYKGVLLDGQEIAVKRLGKTSRQGIEELKSELVLVAKLHHKNLVKLVGVCLEEHERILVYEYMPNRSLDTILFERTRNRTGKVLAIVVPTIVVILATTVVYFFCWKKRRPQADGFLPPTSDDIQHINSLLLDLATLRVATDDFEESKILGKGGFGMVYKGVLLDGQEIAVKRLGKTSRQGIEELKSELVLVAKLHHKNLVKLVGVCLEEHERILVYEYMPNRSLDTILFDFEKKTELDWGKRFKIINGIARALQYLHEDSQPKIIHRDLKASNILLDFDYTPKISDFGLAKIFGGDQSEDVTRRIAGTYGYMAPEYAMRGQYSIKSDVFSFGVLVLEIVTGRRNSGPYNTEQDIDLLNLVWENWTRGSVIELIDPSLSNHPPVDQIVQCIHVGLLCVQRKPASRPTMSSVNIMFSSRTVRLPSLSRPAFCIQDSEAYPLADNLSSNQVSITEVSPR